MTDYNKSVNFAVKDTLTSGDPNKIVSGAEIDTEFNNIASASGTKADKVFAATANNFAGLNASGNLIDSGSKASDFAEATDTENRLSTLETDIDTKANKVSSPTENNFASLDSDGDLKDSGQNQTTIINISSPTGAVTAFAASTAPTGWLECDGSAVSRTTYADLFATIGTTFGLGDGTNTFNLPDLRGEFVRGWDDGRGVDSGRSFGSSQLDQMQRIIGQLSDNRLMDSSPNIATGVFSSSIGSGQSGNAGSQAGEADSILFDSGDSPNARVSSTTNGETRPRNVALMYIIKT